MLYCKQIISIAFAATLLQPGVLHAQSANDKPRIKIIATGGTIANSPDGRMAVETVLSQVPRIGEFADIDVRDYIRVGSSEITIQNWIDIANVIMEELRADSDIDGIVVTHGSNTAEETAYFLNLVLDTKVPIVVVGAQRQRTTLSEDGSRNFYDAVRVAAHPEAGGRGVLLVVNEMIHAARDVTKTLSYRTETWDSGDLGALGLADVDRIRFYRTPTTRNTINSELQLDGITRADELPRVDIVYTYADAGPELVQAAVAAGAKGIVVAGFPTGSPTPAIDKALKKAEGQGVAVVMSHRGGRGRVQTGRPFTSADNLTPQKARILLMLALAHGATADELEGIFSSY
ncbi:MAG: asparaginase [Gammaproteobacteria bacterium]|nr:asparaginase [Gammaproteobacteria bacterium]